MKKIITILIMLLAGLVVKSQVKYVYGYDANGNRISRMEVPFKIPKDTVTTDSTANITDSAKVADNNQANQQHFETMLGEQKITVYPNPTKGELTIDITNFALGSKGFILVTDMQSRIIYKSENINPTNIINISAAAPGKYIMKLLIDGKSNEWIIVKE